MDELDCVSLEILVGYDPHLTLSNCANCSKLLLGSYGGPRPYLRQKRRQWNPPTIHGRIKGRCYCEGCLNAPTTALGGHPGPRDISGEWGSWDNAIRRLEA